MNKKVILGLMFLILSTLVLNGQYFGRNKVQYETFDFKVLKTENFDIYFYPQEEKAVQMAARMAERWYARLSRILDHELKGRQILILYASSPHFQQTTAIPGIIGEGTGGVTEMLKRRIVLPLAASLSGSEHVIGHELVHAFQFSITSQDHPRYAGAAPTALRLHLWFIEGLAEYLSIGAVDPHTAMWMRDVTQRGKLPDVKNLTDPQYFPYRYGQSLWAYITGKWGDSAVPRIMKAVGKAGDLEGGIKRVTGASFEELSKGWHRSLQERYRPLAKETQITPDSSRSLITGTKMMRLNVSPALSPNGNNLVFLSSRDLFSIDLYLADGDTGKVKEKLVGTAVDPHFQSLQFIKSSGSWNGEGTRFVFGAISRGRPVLTVVNISNGESEMEIGFPDLGEILNPTWSPDGRFVAFSALAGGLTDLYLYDMEKEQTTRLTDDVFSDLQPDWSPDGKSIAFVTDRFSSDLSILDVGEEGLAIYHLNTNDIEPVSTFKGSKSINPQWSPDSQSLYFLSDQNGITDIYRKDLTTQEIFQVTNLYTGVSGITASSPALSVARNTGEIVYCVYEDEKYNIYSIESSAAARGERTVVEFEEVNPSILPPRSSLEGEVSGLLRNPLFGLPKEQEYEVQDYHPKLTLDYIAPPQVAIGVDRFGTYGGGGIALFFSDVLGYHSLSTMAQVNSRLIDSAVLVGYQYSKYRWNLGAVIQRIPYVTGGFSQYTGSVFNEPAVIEEELLFRQINYQVLGMASYPFNQVHRFELSAGYQYLNFDREIRTRAYSLIDGTQLLDEKEDLPAPDSIQFGLASAALVYDSSFFGATGPILGQRYRFEVSPAIGTINYVNALADFRKYFMPLRPFTLAFRVLHYGRYGSGAEDSRLYPLFIGYQDLVRGYNTGSFSAEECGSGDNCRVYNQLFGSKMIVANAEIRFPLFQVLGIGEGYYGVLPIEVAAFFDSGLAWFSDDEAWFMGGERKPVSSAGVGLRMNLFGYAIVGAHLVHPFDRPQKGWYFQFSFTPGF